MPPTIRAIPRQRLVSRRLLIIVALVSLVSLLLATLGEQVFMRVVRPDTLRIVITGRQWNPYEQQLPPVVAYDVTIHSEDVATRVRDLLAQLPHYGRAFGLCVIPSVSYDYTFTLTWHGIVIETSELPTRTYDSCTYWSVSVGGVPELLPHNHTLASYSVALRAMTDLTHTPYLVSQ